MHRFVTRGRGVRRGKDWRQEAAAVVPTPPDPGKLTQQHRQCLYIKLAEGSYLVERWGAGPEDINVIIYARLRKPAGS